MTNREHRYDVETIWRGSEEGNRDLRSYSRNHELRATDRPIIAGSSDPAFRGDPTRWNPEQLLVGSLSQCHMLWYLHLAAEAGVVVLGYHDEAHGVMVEDGTGAGAFREVVLRPAVVVAQDSMLEPSLLVHGKVPQYCFIARSVNFPVRHEPTARVDRRRGTH